MDSNVLKLVIFLMIICGFFIYNWSEEIEIYFLIQFQYLDIYFYLRLVLVFLGFLFKIYKR